MLRRMTNKTSFWPAVVLVAVVVAGVVVLSVTHADTSQLERLVPLVVVPLLGYLLNQVSKVKEQTNGNTSELLRTIARQAELLAQAPPVPATAPVTPPDTGTPADTVDLGPSSA